MTNPNPKLFTLLAATTLTACAGTANPTGPAGAPEDEPMVGMANPASVYCIEQGGKLEMRKDEAGNEYAMCHLPDGTVVEEWTLFRSKHPS